MTRELPATERPETPLQVLEAIANIEADTAGYDFGAHSAPHNIQVFKNATGLDPAQFIRHPSSGA